MTHDDAFAAFASVMESNPRYMELVEKHDNQTITVAEQDELSKLVDSVFFSPFMLKNFMAINEEENEEENARNKAFVQAMYDKGIL